MSKFRNAAFVPGAILIGALLSVGAYAEEASEKVELDDAQLDEITAGAAAEDEQTVFEIVRNTRSGKTITADGSLKVLEATDLLSAGQLTLTDYAQQNLRSVVNINAVNSNVNVLLNLNVTIDSTVGTVNQFNLSGALPRGIPAPGR